MTLLGKMLAKIKIVIINFILFVILFLFMDIIFSKFYFLDSVDYKCYDHVRDGRFYQLKKNCFAKMRLLENINEFDVYTNSAGNRFSGKKEKKNSLNSILLVGDSFTFGVGLDWDKTYAGQLENKIGHKYNIINTGVPSYSPTVYKYSIKKTVETSTVSNIRKVFLLLDITDIPDESNRWKEIDGLPSLYKKKILVKPTTFKKIKRKYFKGTFLLSSEIRERVRKIKKKYLHIDRGVYEPVNGNPTGGYQYIDHDELTGCKTPKKMNIHWKCGGVEKGKRKIENQLKDIGEFLSNKKIEFYIIILPWPDTLNLGQNHFDFQKFTKNLCIISKCRDVVNLYPEFYIEKKTNKNWLKLLYLPNDIHLSEYGNSLIVKKLISKKILD